MASTSTPPSPTPLLRQPLDNTDDIQMAPLPSTYDGRRPFRTRPRRLLALLFAAALVTTLLLFSQRPFLSENIEPHRAFFAPRPSISLQNTVPLTGSPAVPTAVVEHVAVEPVIFALLMHSEVSAKEGAILLKV
jgi:hypothetical protein